MTANGEQGDDLAEDIVGVEAYEAPRPPQKKFQPWHRPRKQFVRKEQWAVQLEALLDARSSKPEVLRYLGLPGIDLLDLRHVHDVVCRPRSIQLAFLGFNSAISSNSDQQTEINISLDEVLRLPNVATQSKIIPDDIRRLSNLSSIGNQTARSLGPFDVVNLDLCDGFGKQEPGIVDDSHYNALAQILSIQLLNPNPWLLFLTTRVGHADVHAELLRKFQDIYERNLTDIQAFRDLSAEKFGVNDRDSINSACATERGHADVFLIGLCKWLSQLVLNTNPPAQLEVTSVLGYKVLPTAASEDLISCAIRFTPRPGVVNDPAGVATILSNRQTDEGTIAVKTLRRIANRGDVDTILADDVDLQKQMLDEMAGLLELARYDRTAFLAWAASS